MFTERIKALALGESRKVSFAIPVRELAVYDVVSEKLVIETGKYEVSAGPSSTDAKVSATVAVDGATLGLRDMTKKIKADHFDSANGIQIVEGLYGYSALTAACPSVYEPGPDGQFSATYENCRLSQEATTLRLHGYAPADATVRVFADDRKAAELTVNTRDYEKNPSEARNRMQRAAEDERLRKQSWPTLWADIRIPLDPGSINGSDGHSIRIEAEGPFKYDWFTMI